MEVTFEGELVHWRGPAPWHFVPVPEDVADAIAAEAAVLSYGWGCLYAEVRLGDTAWRTALFPKDGGYLVPVKAQVRRSERLELGDFVTLTLALDD